MIGPSASPAPTDGGGGSAYVIPSQTVTPLQGLAGGGRARDQVDLRAGTADRRLAARDPVLGAQPRVRRTPFGGSYTRHADRTRDWHLRAGDHQHVRVLHADLPVAQRPAADRQSGHAAAERVLGVGLADPGSDVFAADLRRVERADLGDAVGARSRHRRCGGRRQAGIDGGRGGLRRHRVRGDRPAEPQPAVGAERAGLGRRRGQPAYGRRRQCGRAGADAMAVPGGRRDRCLVSGADRTGRRWPACCSVRSTRAAICR